MLGIEFEVIWFDQEAIEYRVTCSNGLFCGTTDLYSSHESLANAANLIRGFPASIRDSRNVTFGTFEPTFAGGGVSMTFQCTDSAGHKEVLVKLRDDGRKQTGKPQSVDLILPIEPSAIDFFVARASSIGNTLGSKANLNMANRRVS
jgi:hypothetical protein